MFEKVLVANRGEIAIRVFRTLRELGIGAVGVYSEGDRAALHVAYADEAFLLGPTPAAESYLAVDRILDAAQRAGAQAVHPGYGFLAENAAFAQAVGDAGLVWIGPRHAEVQVLADSHGNVVHLGERDCTIQRRHQKLIEETPSPAVDDELRQRIGAIGVDAARACGYRSAGTIEGLLTRDGDYFFMEMNTRIQVEHTVTEMVTGLDLVREQILVALGEPLSVRQEDVELRGHAIECRINAEDAARGFLPAPARITGYREPSGPGVRVDSGVAAGYEVSGAYDPLVAKLIVHGVDREHARRRMLRALDEFWIEGPTTLIGFHKALVSHPCFVAGETCHGVVESDELATRAAELAWASPAALPSNSLLQGTTGPVPTTERVRTVEVDGRRFEVRLSEPEPEWRALARRRRDRVGQGGAGVGGSDAVVSPMQGTVLSVPVADGDEVAAGQVICVVEAMKMENEVHAHGAGTVRSLSVEVGQPVATGQLICEIAAD